MISNQLKMKLPLFVSILFLSYSVAAFSEESGLYGSCLKAFNMTSGYSSEREYFERLNTLTKNSLIMKEKPRSISNSEWVVLCEAFQLDAAQQVAFKFSGLPAEVKKTIIKNIQGASMDYILGMYIFRKSIREGGTGDLGVDLMKKASTALNGIWNSLL